MKVTLHTAKPGIIIGRGGAGVDLLKSDLEKLTGKTVHVNVQEIRHLETNAQLICSLIGIDETFSQTVHARHGYLNHDIAWNQRFADILRDENGERIVDYAKFNDLVAEEVTTLDAKAGA